MIGFKHARAINSTLDLNGPTLSTLTAPSQTSPDSETRVLTATTQATFPSDQTSRNGNTGTLGLQWHEVGVGPLTDGANISGSTTNTLTLSNLSYANDNGRQFFLQTDYVNSAYGSGLTANALNEPFNTNNIVISVAPTPSFLQQPLTASNETGNVTLFSVTATIEDNTSSLFTFDWYLDGVLLQTNPAPNVRPVFPSGITASSREEPLLDVDGRISTLEISNASIQQRSIYCIAKHPVGGNIQSNTVSFETVQQRAMVAYERYDSANRNLADGETRDLSAYGPIVFRKDTDASKRGVCIYAPERDVDVKITMGAGKGYGRLQFIGLAQVLTNGGEGGISVFKLTLKKNEEYQIRFSAGGIPDGGSQAGMFASGNGGGSTSIYHKGSLLAVCGGGGGGGTNGDGGDGGGINVAGEVGAGTNGGSGGAVIPEGTIPIDGELGDFGQPGRINGCTKGNYYFNAGFSPCEDVGTVQYLDSLGFALSGSATILRGFKSGLAGRRNGEYSFGNQGPGGGGGVGGSAATSSGSGGGGASGYSSGNITLLSSSTLPSGTRLGGNADEQFITIEEFDPLGDQSPNIPLIQSQFFTRFLKYTITLTRSSSNLNTVTYTRRSGTGPDTITFGPTAGTNTAQVELGAVYERTGSASSTGNTLNFRVVNRALQVSEDGVDFTDLTVSLDSGGFSGSVGQTLQFS